MESHQWEKCAPLLSGRSSFSLIAAHGYIYAIGGMGTDGIPLASVERYDFRKNSWAAVSPMLTSRVAAAVAILDGDIVVIGGHTAANKDCDSVEKFDGKKWSTVIKMGN